MDTPGLGVCHSLTPNLSMAALREPRLGVTFSAFWPTRDIHPGTPHALIATGARAKAWFD